ncbi:ATP synthase subunit I [Anoxybacillus sp.]|uniref:ATP synthase subunit I n=1 Tax=Anoxybacillus sp. TaxID=1872573 RepID=UPI002601EF93|nr:ATP synthase subunit I [uncultured Anoxybacillus sp.]
MNELQRHWRRHKSYILYLLAVYVLGWAFTPYKQAFSSLLLGTIISSYNSWTMVRKVERFGQAVASGQKARSLGMMSRMAAAAFAVFIAFRWPEQFSVGWIVVGLMTSYIVIIIDFFFQNTKGEER